MPFRAAVFNNRSLTQSQTRESVQYIHREISEDYFSTKKRSKAMALVAASSVDNHLSLVVEKR